MARLDLPEIEGELTSLAGWGLTGPDEEPALRKVFTFRGFRQAMAFVNDVAALATQARHHPDILINYNRVTLTLTTHDEGGITEKDIDLARQIEATLTTTETS